MSRSSDGFVTYVVLCMALCLVWFPVALADTPSQGGEIPINVQPASMAPTYEPLAYRDEQWYDSTFWTGPDWTRVGRNWQHPGENTPSVRCFVSPQDGRVTITGQVRKADVNGGDGVRIFIRHEADTVWRAEIEANDATGVAHNLTLDIRTGDVLRFIIHRRGAIPCDTTYWDPAVAFEDGPRFIASEGYATALNDAVPWRYEMETSPGNMADGLSTSRIYAFTTGLIPQSWDLDEQAAPIVLGSATHLPFVIVSKRGGRGGACIQLGERSGNWLMDVSPPDDQGNAVVRWKSSGDSPKVGDYSGDWRQVLDAPDMEKAFRQAFRFQQRRFSLDLPPMPPMLWGMVTEAWMLEDGQPQTPADFMAASTKHLERCLPLVDKLKDGARAGFAEKARVAVMNLLNAARSDKHAYGDAEGLYITARRIKRELLLRRPEMSFEQLLFCKRVPGAYSHLVMQYFGWRARPGGGIFVLDRPGYSLDARDILDGRLAAGSTLQPCLDWDGERIVFSYVEQAGLPFRPEDVNNEEDKGCYHLWTVNADGSGLRQLTTGAFDDLMPAWLPDGDIIFCSTRRKGHSRCFGPNFSGRWHSYTLHRLAAESGAITRLSSNDVSEWFPVVSQDGLVYYSRWDYIDRDAVTHQTLWSSRPDGTNPMAIWGNGLPNPHCTFQIQPIPESNKFVFVASAHHSITGGSLVALDPARGENALDAMQRITPEVPFPEAESMNIPEWYAAPWPLAEDLFLTAYSPYPLVWEPGANRRDALGIYLIDTAGNHELIYRDPEIGATNPVPLRPRPQPPVLDSPRDASLGDMGEFFVANVYEGLKGVVAQGAVKELRIVQIFPKTTPLGNTPPIGLAGEENARAVLGTVPVGPDGSVRFKAPAHKPLLFQLLDEDGRAVQIMRSLTYLQPGERVSCVGCHEGRRKAAPNVLAGAGRSESLSITPGPFDGKPFSYMRVVQPVLDKYCVQCHSGEKAPRGIDLTGTPDRGFTRSYCALFQDIDARKQAETGKTVEPLVPRYMARNQVQITPPGGQNGARGSLLLRMLDQGHNKVSLTPEDKRRLAMWIDCNAIFYGTFSSEQHELQLTGGEIPMPETE